MKLHFLFALLFVSTSACDRNDGPPLEVIDSTVFAPLPGTSVSVAYMSIRNNTQVDIVIDSIRSPQFESASLHETQVVAGVSKMARIESMRIPARSTVALVAGGLHIMLMKPHESMHTNQTVSLEFAYDADGLLIVGTTIQARFGRESND